MRTERFRRGLGSILLAFVIVLSIAIPATSAWIPEDPFTPFNPTVIEEPGGTTITVYPGGTFTIQFKLRWFGDCNGYFSLGFYWDSPNNGGKATENENFTFVSASAYFEDNGDPIAVNTTFSEGLVGPNWRHHIVVDHTVGDGGKDNFYVDIVLRASSAGGVPHIAPDNHIIKISGTIDVAVCAIYSYAPPDPNITVRVLGRGVAVSVSPSENSGPPGATLNYSVTVTNTGVEDNYDLTISENEDWGPTLDNYLFENVQPDESRTTTLSITVPENAVPYTEDDITVTATSQVDNQVKDNDSCIARVVPWTGTAVFSLENVWAVRLEKNLDIYQGSKLVVKFYTWGGPFQDESVIENFSPPWHVEENEFVPHLQDEPVENVRLVLTDNTGSVISTIATFTVTKSILMGRISAIKSEWPFAPPMRKTLLMDETSVIKGKWPFAPT